MKQHAFGVHGEFRSLYVRYLTVLPVVDFDGYGGTLQGVSPRCPPRTGALTRASLACTHMRMYAHQPAAMTTIKKATKMTDNKVKEV